MDKKLLLILFVLIKLNGLCQEDYITFSNQFGIGSELNDAAEYVALTETNDRIVFGYFNEETDFDPGEIENSIDPFGEPDLFLASYSPENELNWVINIGRIALIDGMDAGGLALDGDGNIYIAGGFSLTVDFDPSPESASVSSLGGSDAFLAKFDPEGNFMWVKSIGSPLFETFTALSVDTQGNVYTGLRFNGEVDANPEGEEEILTPVGGTDAALIKMDSDGNFEWAQPIQPGGNGEKITEISTDEEGNIALGASIDIISSGIPEQSMWFGLFQPGGAQIWNIDFQNTGQFNEISEIAFAQNGEALYLGGRIRTETDFDPSEEESLVSPTFTDPYLAKYSVDQAELLWVKYIESSSTEDYCNGIKEADGNVFMVGTFDVNAIFVPGDFNSQVASNGSRDMFVAVYDAVTGDFIDGDNYGSGGDELIISSAFGDTGELIVVGAFLNSMSFDPEETIPSNGVQDILLGGFAYPNSLSSNDWEEQEEITIYPVPSPDFVRLQFPADFQTNSVTISVMNVVGQKVLKAMNVDPGNQAEIDISALNKGIYIMEIEYGSHKISKRLIKQ